MNGWIQAGSVEELRNQGPKLIKGGIVVFYHEDQVHALDNRCPHLGFPLHMGSLCNGILTCHWHHARFDVCSGGTLDPWADDVPVHDLTVHDGLIWVNPNSRNGNQVQLYKDRLLSGLEQNIGLVIAKAIVGLMEAGVPGEEIAAVGIEFGVKQRRDGWGSGLTILTAMTNILPKLDKQGQILALFQGLLHTSRDSAGSGTRFLLDPLPNTDVSIERLTEWYRECIEVRDTRGAERVLLTAVQAGADESRLFSMMSMAATDHFYINGGHTLDFHNKAFESLKYVGDEQRADVLASLVPMFGNASRTEELHSWQSPVNLVQPLKDAFEELSSQGVSSGKGGPGIDDEELLQALLGDDPLRTIRLLKEALLGGASPVRISQIAALAAAERIVRFPIHNDFGDWISVLHTFTHAHAVHEGLIRSADPGLVRGILHTAVTIYLDRFLNIPAAPRPSAVSASEEVPQPSELLEILDKQQQVAPAAAWVMRYLRSGGKPEPLFNVLGHALLREDAEFHSFQMYEAAVAEYDRWASESGPFAEKACETLILAVTRYLAAHAPTSRELPHTAWRLHRGEKLFEEE
ncbi:Rieske 2Fe-2S domain-containing protein [Paenibacillus cellulositrophicus]|uniref:Rieske (2Fe-2S) protein n=1 Tax=Paenibacillus cellulositrophicus TaxID=562959 RepID=UPI00203A9725|nr:Rieske 2Fe-2S domain-containing protein [Paenibacillus cellulositrophicus]MCM2998704.1 Rieske 2Fe-2S domain-containing protein [Paenibacillus cellulositrophicus]